MDQNRKFTVNFILARGSETQLEFFGFNEDDQTRSQPMRIAIRQTSPPVDLEAILNDLFNQKEEVMSRIQQSPNRGNRAQRPILK